MNWRSYAALAASLAVFAPASALADIAPVVSYVGSVGPNEQSPVAMESEVVTFTVPKDFGSPEASRKADIAGEAKFFLKNSSEAPVTVSSVFPIYLAGEGGANAQYAKNVRVAVDGQSVPSALKDDATYPQWDGKNWKTVTEPGYVFTFTMDPGARREVVVTFDAPQTEADGWAYMLSSGAGWSGAIEKATIKVVYPYPLHEGWVAVEGQKTTISGSTATFVLSGLEPTPKSDLRFSVLRPEFANAILKAESLTDSQPSQPNNWLALANANKAVVYYHGQVPEWAVAGYWKAINTYLDRKYGSHTAPTTVEGATTVAEIYTDHWANPCDGAGCRTWEDTEAANALLQHIRTVMLPGANTTDHDALVSIAGKLETWLTAFGVEARAAEPEGAPIRPTYTVQEITVNQASNPWVAGAIGAALGLLAAAAIRAIMAARKK